MVQSISAVPTLEVAGSGQGDREMQVDRAREPQAALPTLAMVHMKNWVSTDVIRTPGLSDPGIRAGGTRGRRLGRVRYEGRIGELIVQLSQGGAGERGHGSNQEACSVLHGSLLNLGERMESTFSSTERWQKP